MGAAAVWGGPVGLGVSIVYFGVDALLKSMYKAYKYLFYKLYSWALKLHGEADLPEYTSLFTIAFLTLLNLISVPLLLKGIFGLHIDLPETSKVVSGILCLVVAFFII